MLNNLRLDKFSNLLRSSTQAGYRFGFSIEGNAVKNEAKRIGDVGRLFEVGTPIGITRRNIAKVEVIQP